MTEASDQEKAEELGVNFSPKLANALGTAAVQEVDVQEGLWNFAGTVDFSPERVVVPGPEGFPPDEFQAGAVGDDDYSPLVTTGDGVVLNASQVANETGMHDAVVNIDYERGEVTLEQFLGFYEFEEVLYLHQEASIELVAALEGSTWAPNLNAAPGLASNDPETSARSAIVPIINGQRGEDNPQRQGMESALLGEGDPLNITQEEPGMEDGEVLYSPVWDIHLAVWTDAAIEAGDRVRLVDTAEEVVAAVEAGTVVSGAEGPPNASLGGLRALDAISNCPITANLGPAEGQE